MPPPPMGNLRLVANLLKGDFFSFLKALQFYPARDAMPVIPAPKVDDDWRLARRDLEVVCEARQIQLEFPLRECRSAVEFWEYPTGERFWISGFEDSVDSFDGYD